ncbi:MAG: LytTR family DNA-binding domain-containing protein [Bacteroidota bacterium]
MIDINVKSEVFEPRSNLFFLTILSLVMGISVFQDYLFSEFRNTGFYISESLLYNTIWAFLLPLICLQSAIDKKIESKITAVKFLLRTATSITLSIAHILCFALFFVGVSSLLFSPPHKFVRIFTNALSNQFYILFLFYVLAPYVKQYVIFNTRGPVRSKTKYPSKIKVKSGSKFILLETNRIQIIAADKPYTAIISDTEKYLDNRPLKNLEDLLNPYRFVRVHRSKIINPTFVKELRSRQNGDYDAILENGHYVRLSRHYKQNWEHLLH